MGHFPQNWRICLERKEVNILHLLLGGGFKQILLSPRSLQKVIQFDQSIFQTGGSTTNWRESRYDSDKKYVT